MRTNGLGWLAAAMNAVSRVGLRRCKMDLEQVDVVQKVTPRGTAVNDLSPDHDGDDKKAVGNENPNVTLTGVVEKIVKPIHESEPEKAQIVVQGADDLYKEIRIENELKDADGESVKLKQGAEVEVTIEAPKDAVEKKTA